MEKVLDTLNFQIRRKRRNVILVLDNATVHPTSLIDMYSNKKIIFLTKNTLGLQPLDARIIQSFKTKYRKKFMWIVIAHINDDLFVSDIAKSIDILQAIAWMANAWKVRVRVRRLALKRSRTALQNVVLLSKQVKIT